MSHEQEPITSLTAHQKETIRAALVESSKKLLGVPHEFGAEWSAADLLLFLFPKKYRATQYEYAVKLMDFMVARGGEINYMELGDFVEKTGVSKATLYSKIVPRLIDVGMVERHRKYPENRKNSMRILMIWENQVVEEARILYQVFLQQGEG